MSDSKMNELLNRLGELMERQNGISQELIELRSEIKALKSAAEGGVQESAASPPQVERTAEPKKVLADFVKESKPEPTPAPASQPKKPSILAQNWEKFIGENLISKIGIAIIVLGVGIGAKYAIDNELINPLTRIILGYLAGVALMVFAIRLKAEYDKFSAVLLSGAIAILYFITFAAYDFYDLIPQPLTFVLMVLFTVFAVLSALKYDMSVIAHMGLLGAYAVPFLLSNKSGNEVALFSYMSIVNLGILFISFKKDWKKLYYSAFGLSWIIFLGWSGFNFSSEDHLTSGLIFGTLFFIIFYVMLLAFKVVKGQKFKWDDIILLIVNSFVYFAVGYYFLDNHEVGSRLLGVFALANAIIHFIVGLMLYKRQLADKNLFYFVIGLVIVFITIAVPIQLDGSWVTMLWVGEAALLFWIGRTKDVPIYEKLSYVLIATGFVSLLQDWEVHTLLSYYQKGEYDTPFVNVAFYSSLLVTSIYGFINYLHIKFSAKQAFKEGHILRKMLRFVLPGIFLVVLFNSFRLEIANYWNLRYIESAISIPDGYTEYNFDLLIFGNLWNFCYSMFFLSALLYVNVKKLREPLLAGTALIVSGLVILGFLTNGLLELHNLRDSYLNQSNTEYFSRSGFYIGFRYVAFLFFGGLMVTCYWQIKQKLLKVNLEKTFNIILMVALLFILSSELLNLMDLAGEANSFRLSLSILWGLYSLVVIVLGIWKRQKYLRIAAIVIFGVTLLKVFFYDITDLDTISKTIVFVSLGILLLITSFLYNKYKHLISESDAKD